MALFISDPARALFPDQLPEAVQLVTLVPVQLKVVVPFSLTELGLAEKESVGIGAVTVIPTDSVALPPAPVQVRLNVLSAISGPVDCEPVVGRLPDQSPEALQSLVLPLFQLKVVDSPSAKLDEFTVKLTQGADGDMTVMLAESFTLPPLPLQVRMNSEFVIIPLITCVPDVALYPDHPPDAIQSLACLLFQLIVVEPFTGTVVGLADNNSVGSFGPLTEMSTLSFIFPGLDAVASETPRFVSPWLSSQANSKVLFALSA